MPKKPRVIAAALPASALPEIAELLDRYSGGDQARSNVVMVRLGDQALDALDQLVETGLFRSRSDSAAFLIAAGMESQSEMLSEIARHTTQIKEVRERLRDAVEKKLKGRAKTLKPRKR